MCSARADSRLNQKTLKIRFWRRWTAAFSFTGTEEATEKEAKKIVKEFKNKEVH